MFKQLLIFLFAIIVAVLAVPQGASASAKSGGAAPVAPVGGGANAQASSGGVAPGGGASSHASAGLDQKVNKFITGPRPVTSGTAINKMYDFYELCKKNEKINILEVSYEKLDKFLEEIEFDKAEDVTPQTFAEVIAYLAANHDIKLFMDIKYEKSPMRARSDKSGNILNVKWPYVWEEDYVYEELPNDLHFLGYDQLYDSYVRTDGLNSLETTVKEAMTQFPGIDWVLLINKLSTSTGANMKVNCSLMDCALYFKSPSIIDGVSDFVDVMHPSRFKSYIQIRIKEALKNSGNDDGVNCLNLVNKTFSAVVSHMLFKEAHQTSAAGENQKRSKAYTTLNILTRFREMIEKLPQIQNNTETISYVNKKIKIVELVIEIQKTFLKETRLDKLYEDFVVEKGKTFDSLYFKAQQFMAKRSIEEENDDIYRNKVVELRYFMTLLYAAGLVNPYFTPDDIPAITYGALGAIIGDQIIHNSHNFLNNYNEREYEVNWMEAAYDAFISDPISHENLIPKTFPNLTNKQLFFLSFGKHWCRSNNSQMLFKCESVTTLYEHVHLLKRLRNFAPFREAFNCADTSKHVTEKHTTTELPTSTLSSTTTTTTTSKPFTTKTTKSARLAPKSTSTTTLSGEAPIFVDNDLEHAPEQHSHDLFTSNVDSKVASKPNAAAKPIAKPATMYAGNVLNEALTKITADKPTSDASTILIGNIFGLPILLGFAV
uniref:Peptidase_M13 domain-containing protein n=1 Tax=Panagrellus redivivus TaxID=6233 RepID=A0A7E4UNB1_PANRE